MTHFDKAIDRSGTGSIKWDKYKNHPDVIPMWVADSDFQTCPAVIEALQKRVAQGVFGYTAQPTDELAEAIIYHLDKCYGWQIDSAWIILLPSLVSGLNLSCHIAGNMGDTVISPETIYPPFKTAPLHAQREVLTVPMHLLDGRWVLDFKALEHAFETQSHIRMLLFCNPHNPGGTVYTRHELEHLHSICQQHDIVICSDEIHCDLMLDQDKQHIPLATLNEDAAMRSITLMAASKTFNIAGLSCGFAIVENPQLRSRLKQATQGLLPEVNLLGQVATTAAFRHGDDWMAQQNAYLRENRDYLYREINAIPGLNMVLPEATFLAWIDVSALNLQDPYQFFLEAGLGLSAGSAFGDSNFVRLNFACPKSTLIEAVQRIKNAVQLLS